MASRVEEYRQMDEEELYGRLAQSKQELFNLRFQLVTGRLDNSSRLGQVKREVARILTVMREREIVAAEALAAAGAPAAVVPGATSPGATPPSVTVSGTTVPEAAGADQGESE